WRVPGSPSTQTRVGLGVPGRGAVTKAFVATWRTFVLKTFLAVDGVRSVGRPRSPERFPAPVRLAFVEVSEPASVLVSGTAFVRLRLLVPLRTFVANA